MDALNPRWTRLEPYSRDTSLQYGLNAEVHDPLWLLARQWQLLEFWGEDAGSPIWAELDVTYAPITRYHLQPQNRPPSQVKVEGQTLDGSVPLEVLVERETVRDTNGPFPPLRLAAEAGLQFLRLLNANGAGALRAKAIADFPLTNPLAHLTKPEQEEELHKKQQRLGSDTVHFIEVMSGRVPDGIVLRKGVDSWAGIPLEHRAAVGNTIESWKKWYDSLFYEAKDSSWVPPRLEYQALIAASTPQGEAVLNATEYADGHLDWYSFDAMAGASLGAAPSDPSAIDTIIDRDPNKVAKRTVKRSVIPTPVRFPGMPVSRYWEFEDAKVDFGAIAAGEQQLAHLLLIDFGLVSGDDWFIIPVTLPVGTLCYTDTLTVLDTFGMSTQIPSTRALDKDRKAKGLSSGLLPWDLFHLSGDESKTDALFLPPTLGRSLQGKSIEEVLFMRDEMANMVWAVERTIESALGRPLNQSEAYFRTRKEKTPPSVGPDATLTRLYKLASEVPSHWVPMLPVPIQPGRADRLGFTTGRRPQGRVMTELWTVNQAGKPLYGEEVPREGVRVSRAYQYTRWTNGQSYLWVGRRNEVGRGEGSSGLVFDQLVPPSDPNKQGPA